MTVLQVRCTASIGRHMHTIGAQANVPSKSRLLTSIDYRVTSPAAASAQHKTDTQPVMSARHRRPARQSSWSAPQYMSRDVTRTNQPATS